jgi:predicted DNA-binding transcriptional regulator AlpA
LAQPDLTKERRAKKTERPEPHPHPLSVRPADLAARLGISPRHVTNLRRHPDPERRLPPAHKIGRMTVWRFADIEEWLDRQTDRSAAV